MKKDADKVVDFCRYRELQTKVRQKAFAHPRPARAHPLYFPVPFLIFVPVPIMWLPYSTMMHSRRVIDNEPC
jgi:hypothetical protein